MGCHCIQQFVLRTTCFVSHNCLLKIIIVSAREEKSRFSSIKGRLCRGTPFLVQTLVLFHFSSLFFSYHCKRDHGGFRGRLITEQTVWDDLRRGASPLVLRSKNRRTPKVWTSPKPLNGCGFVHPRTNFAFIRPPLIITFRIRSKS